jgi:hypothetical protein
MTFPDLQQCLAYVAVEIAPLADTTRSTGAG